MNVSDCIGELLLIAGKCFPVNPEIARVDLNTNYPYEGPGPHIRIGGSDDTH